jgi:ADP-ribose pyrophosphatase YjhB (NUDIX family)
MGQEIEHIVRALIVRNRHILVCQTNGRDYYFLPGGHVEFGETLRSALKREIYEELGAILTKAQFIGGIENMFDQDGRRKHEISFVYLADIDLTDVASKESHVDFYWFTIEQFINENIVPPALKDVVMQWMAEREPFFVEAGKNR